MKHEHQTIHAQKAAKEFFYRLKDLPCWECVQSHGSWLSLNFGQPHLEVTEANPSSQSRFRRKRRVLVEGDHRLWVEMCEWHIIRNGHELAWSESDRQTIRQALNEINGQKILAVDLDVRRGKASFLFEDEIHFRLKRYKNSSRCQVLWHLFSNGQELMQSAHGHLSIRDSSSDRPMYVEGGEISLVLT